MIIDKNLNPDDYKEELMKKHNLSEEKWSEIADLANMLKQCDGISFCPPWEIIENMYRLNK